MELSHRHKILCAHISYLHRLELSTRCHKANGVPYLYMSVLHTAVDYNSLILVVVAVKYKGFKRSPVVPFRSRYVRNHPFKHLFNVRAHFCRDPRSVHRRYSDNILHLAASPIRVCAWQVYLVYYRHHLKVIFYCKVCVCQRLRLDTL